MVNQILVSPSVVKYTTIGLFKNITVKPVHAKTTSTIAT